jgi:hypothetical protein
LRHEAGSPAGICGIHAAHAITGRCGYFGYRGSLFQILHNTNTEPRPEVIVCACWQEEQSPGETGTGIVSSLPLTAGPF